VAPALSRPATRDPRLTLAHITHHFGSTLALDDVSFDVAAGEVHALLGENGAGKSTLMRVAYGLLAPERGTVSVGGGPVTSPRVARRLGVGMVHQHFTSIPAFTVAENIALAAGWGGTRRALAARAAGVVERLALPLDVCATADALTVQLRQRLEIVQALASEATTLLLDEPTAVLAPREVGALLDWIRGFAEGGGAVVLISHKLREVAAVSDRVTVLRRGRVVLHGGVAEHDQAALARAMFGEGVTSPAERHAPPGRGTVAVEVGALTLHRGEVVGVAAIEGNGQRELLRTIAGVERSRDDVRRTGSVGFIPEDRTTEALIPAWSLAENHLLANLDRAGRWLDWNAAERGAAEVIAAQDVRGGGPTSVAASLSGGNQQRFVLGRALARAPAVLVAEDPARGLDASATAALYRRMREAAAAGACVVMHASDLDELLMVSDRILVMHRGAVRELPLPVSRDALGDAMLGLE
jgi:simple sugar transport system ATP-binding protein